MVNGWVGTASSAGLPLHSFDLDARLVRSFGVAPGQPPVSLSNLSQFRNLPPRGDTLIWTVPMDEFVLEQWNVRTGARVRRISPDEDWVRDAYQDHRERYTNVPLLMGLFVDESDRIWVVGAEPELDPVRRRPGDHGAPVIRDRGEVMDLRLEVIDPASGRVIARARMPHYAAGFLSTGDLFAFRSTERPGEMQVWSLRLRCPGPEV